MLTWLGKSDLPVATILAPASLASHGQISGTGLAQAKTIAPRAMEVTHSLEITPGPGRERAIRTSAPFIASGIPPTIPEALVRWARSHFSG